MNKKELVSFVSERDHKWPAVAAADAEYVGAERAVQAAAADRHADHRAVPVHDVSRRRFYFDKSGH